MRTPRPAADERPRSVELSLVIPVHNGAGFVARSVADARDFLRAGSRSFEILVVDDGSTDGTSDAIRPLTDDGFSGDVELLYIALKYNLVIRRIPVRLQRTSPSTVSLRVHSLQMLLRILRLRHQWSRHRYASPVLEKIASQAYWRPSDGAASEVGHER